MNKRTVRQATIIEPSPNFREKERERQRQKKSDKKSERAMQLG